MPSYGFAFSPADIERGPVYEFKLNHVVEVDDPHGTGAHGAGRSANAEGGAMPTR